jgi:tetratricopeptide (TPR) repeat protein
MRPPRRKTWAFAGVILFGLGSALVSVRDRGHSSSGELVAAARLALKNRQWDRAEALLTQRAERGSPTIDDLALRAELELGRGRFDQAVNLLVGVPESDPLAPRARLVAGQIERSRDRARWAESRFLEAIRLDPKLAPSHRELILLYAMQARRAELNARFRALADLGPLGFDDVFVWTTSLENLWVNGVSQSNLERFLAADPEDRLSRLVLAEVLLRSNQLEESEALLHHLADSDPDARTLKISIALARMRLDEVRSLLSEGPAEHVGLALLRGKLAIRMEDAAAAARQFRIVLGEDPTNCEALQGLSLVLMQLGDRQAAAVAQKQVEQRFRLSSLLTKLKTNDIRHDKALLTQVGAACENLGQVPEARAWYRLALAEDPLDPAIQKCLYRLRDVVKSVGLPASTSSSGDFNAESPDSSP